MRTRLLRAASALAAAGCGLAVWQIRGLASTTGGSPLMTAATVCGLVGVVVGAGITFAPRTLMSALQTRLTAMIVRLRATDVSGDGRLGGVLAGLGIVLYIGICSWHLSQPDDPSDDDQSAFLERASEVQAAGGPVELIRDLYTGRFAEANRHPLYIGLLSINPTQAFGRGLSFVIGLTSLMLLTWLVRGARGPMVAGLFCLLLGINGAYCLFSTRVVCDVLMVTWGGLVYMLVSRDRERPQRDAVLIGAILGLAYLTKGTGLLLFAGYLVWLLGWWINSAIIARRDSGSSREVSATLPLVQGLRGPAIVGVISLAVSSPLLVRNAVLYGAPTYNVNSFLLFVDEYEDPLALSERSSIGEAARGYARTHSIGDIARRATSGLVWESFIVLRLVGPALLDDGRVLIGLPLALYVVMAIVADPRREHGLLAAWTAICVPLFAWYIPIAAGDRFPLPLLAPLLVCAAEGIVRLAGVRSRPLTTED